MIPLLLALALTQTTQPAQPADPDLRVVSYNIENFRQNFEAYKLQREFKGELPEKIKDLLSRERREDYEENYEVAEVIKALAPDVLAIQESAAAEDLEYFNEEFLDGYFETVVQLPSNTTREQHLTLMLRPGYEVLETVTLADVEDVDDLNDREDSDGKLFARGAGFVKLRTPGGDVLWLANTHQKSKGGNNALVTQWRNREASLTRDKALELDAQEDTLGVLIVGDLNDQLGVQEFELEGGGDVIENMSRGLDLLTRELSEAGATSFKGYGTSRYPGMIDHALATPRLTPLVADVALFDGSLTASASDHYPLVIDLDLPND